MRVKFLIAAGILLTIALAEPFLDSLENQPQLRAARARLDADRVAALLAPDWIGIDAQGGLSYKTLSAAEPCPFLSDLDPANDVLCGFIEPEIPEEITQVQLGVTLRPLPFGDYADRQQLRILDRAESELDFRLAKARLEAMALRAALDLLEAQEGLELAKSALGFARTALAATRLRVEKGAANKRELREAELAFERAKNQLEQAKEQAKIARELLRTYTTQPPPAPPWFRSPLPNEESVDETRARIQVERARIGVQNASRDFVPTLELGYTYRLDEENAVGATLETRTLGTRVYYDHSSYADPVQNRTRNEWRIGARLNLSIDTWARSETARRQLQAAEAALDAALRIAEVTRLRHKTIIQNAVREVELARLRLEDARDLELEVAKRLELGLSTTLELLRVQLERLQAALALTRARHEVLRAQLDYLLFMGVAPSEVWR